MAGVWTRNYSNMLAYQLSGAGYECDYYNADYATNNLTVKLTNGSIRKAQGSGGVIYFPKGSYSSWAYGNNYTSGGQLSMQVGTGDTEPTYEDYVLEVPSSNFTISQNGLLVSKFVWDATAKTFATTVRFVVQYTGSSEITVKEFGIFCATQWGSALIYREVFDEPITLNQYESIVLDVTQAFPIINYQPYPA